MRNYPWYRGWYDDFSSKGLTIIGIHTPESEGEKVIASIEKKANAENLKFPILVDNKHENWNAWTNRIWPSVYLIDKQGYIRYWWYGELNWEGAEGEKFMRGKIEELLAEPK